MIEVSLTLPQPIRWLLLLLLPLGTLSAQLQFTSEPYEIEGVPFRHFVAQDGEREMILNPPDGWEVVSGGGGARILPRDPARGQIEMRVIAPAVEGQFSPLFDDDGMPFWEMFCRGMLPPDAVGVEMVSDNRYYGTIDKQPLAEVRFRYGFEGGETYQKAFVIWKRADDIVLFVYTNETSAFEKSLRDLRSTIYSIHYR